MKTYTTKANAKRAAKNQGLDLNTTCIFEQDGLWVIGQVDLFDEAEAAAEFEKVQAIQKRMAEEKVAFEAAQAEAKKKWFADFVPYNAQLLLPAPKDKKEHLVKSTITNPVKLVWEIADKMWGERRSVIIKACTDAGIAYNTARTQYQAFYAIKSKEGKA